MKLHRLILSIILTLATAAGSFAQEKKAIKGFSGGMMVHTGYQFGGDNPYNLNISSPTFGIGGCAKMNPKYMRGPIGLLSPPELSARSQSALRVSLNALPTAYSIPI